MHRGMHGRLLVQFANRIVLEVPSVVQVILQFAWVEDIVVLQHHHSADFLLSVEWHSEFIHENVVDLFI